MTEEQLRNLLTWTVSMAVDFSLETRIRRLIEDHTAVGVNPRTLVMNRGTWNRLVQELDGRGYRGGYFWTPQPEGVLMDPDQHVTTFRGLPILIKNFLPDQEVIVGV